MTVKLEPSCGVLEILKEFVLNAACIYYVNRVITMFSFDLQKKLGGREVFEVFLVFLIK